MPHVRERFLLKKLEKFLKFWPVVGIIGLRQSGKTTLVTKLAHCGPGISLDDLEAREEAVKSPKTFLARLSRPAVIDEVQKAPPLFDAIKLAVDQKRIPGEFLITGSTAFSAKIGIRESLTGRIGLLRLRPFCYGELHQLPPLDSGSRSFVEKIDQIKPRCTSSDVSKSMQLGGMPGVAFMRDAEHRDVYWKSWLDTTLTRDVPRIFKRSYDPDVALGILNRMGQVLADGELPTLHHFSQPARLLRQYFSSFEEVFLVDRIPVHESGKGNDVWLAGDSGLAGYLMSIAGRKPSQLSLVRHFLWNEWYIRHHQQDMLRTFQYYKSAQGSPIDAIIDGVPILVTDDASAVGRRLQWLERPLRGAMKTLGAKHAVIVAPIDHIITAKSNDGIAVVPWSVWC